MTQHASGPKIFFAVIAKITYVLKHDCLQHNQLLYQNNFPRRAFPSNSRKESDMC